MVTVTDSKLPALAQASDDRAMGARLAAALGLGPERAVRARHELLKHAPGKRAVFAFTLEGGGAHGLTVIGKLYRDGRGARAFELLSALWRAARAQARGRLELPEPLAYLPDLGLVVQGVVSGRPLARLGPDGDWSAASRRVAEALAALHDLEVPELPARTLAEHVRRGCRPAPEALAARHPELAPPLRAAVEALGLEACVPPGPAGAPAHGDLGLSQVFVGEDRAAFVDWDGACVAPPALDLARLIVSLRLRLGPRAAEVETELLARYRAARPASSLEGLERYLALAYLRRACTRARQDSDASDLEAVRALLAAAVAGPAGPGRMP